MPYSAKRTITDTFFLRFLSLSVINTSFSNIVKYSYIQKFCIFAAHPTNPVECCADANPKTMLPNDT